jgi:hypothetical protein
MGCTSSIPRESKGRHSSDKPEDVLAREDTAIDVAESHLTPEFGAAATPEFGVVADQGLHRSARTRIFYA